MNRFPSTVIALLLLSVFLFNISCAGIPQQAYVPAPVQQIKQFQLKQMQLQRQQSRPNQKQTASPQQKPAAQTVQNSGSSFWTGSGGKGISLTILPPKDNGLAANEKYLLDIVRLELIKNFTDYSAIDVLDWVRLQDQ